MRTDGRTLNATAMCNYILQYCVRVRFQTFQIQNSFITYSAVTIESALIQRHALDQR